MSITIPATLVAARQAELSAVESGYGARIQYAQCLVDNSEPVAVVIDGKSVNKFWFQDGVEMSALIKAEKQAYYDGLKAIKYSNPSNAWKMIKKYALEYAQQTGLIAKAEGEGG